MAGKPRLKTGRPKTHGGASALAAIKGGDKFRGQAIKVLHDVRRDYRTYGRARLVETAALRLETVSRLFWQAVMKAADDGDLKALDRYAARYGWLQTCTLRAMAQLREEEKAAAGESLEALLGKVVDSE